MSVPPYRLSLLSHQLASTITQFLEGCGVRNPSILSIRFFWLLPLVYLSFFFLSPFVSLTPCLFFLSQIVSSVLVPHVVVVDWHEWRHGVRCFRMVHGGGSSGLPGRKRWKKIMFARGSQWQGCIILEGHHRKLGWWWWVTRAWRRTERKKLTIIICSLIFEFPVLWSFTNFTYYFPSLCMAPTQCSGVSKVASQFVGASPAWWVSVTFSIEAVDQKSDDDPGLS